MNEIESRRTKLKIGKEIPIFIKTAPFCTFKKKKKEAGTRRRIARYCSLSSPPSCPSGRLPGVLAASFGPQIRQSMHRHVHLEPIYHGEWSGRVKKVWNSSVLWPKSCTSGSLQIWQFEVHTLNQRFELLKANQGLGCFSH